MALQISAKFLPIFFPIAAFLRSSVDPSTQESKDHGLMGALNQWWANPGMFKSNPNPNPLDLARVFKSGFGFALHCPQLSYFLIFQRGTKEEIQQEL